MIFSLNSLSVIQPALTINYGSSFILNQQSVIQINILFSISIVRHWYSLPDSVVEAGSLSRFKSALIEALSECPLTDCFVYLIVLIDHQISNFLLVNSS